VATPVELVVGLGNPGSRYARTRHNAGFWFVDALARRAGATFRESPRFFGETCELAHGGRRLRLLKPITLMNRSGRSVAALSGYYRIGPEALLIVYDEIDLPPGVVRLKRGGGHGGHNGLRDVLAHLGDPGFARLRIGVGHPGRSDEVVDYVLRRAPAAEQQKIDDALERSLDLFDEIVTGDLPRAMNVLHTRAESAESDTSE